MHPIREYQRPLERPVLDWKNLTPGERVVIVDRRGLYSSATVDTVSDEGNLVWLVPQNVGYRTLYLRTDPIMLHKNP